MASLKQILEKPAYNLKEDHLPTNTWPNRHEYAISVARNLIYADMRNVSLAIFGAGGVAADHAQRLPKGDELKFKESFVKRKMQQYASWRESGQRDKPNAKLWCWEPQEWYDALFHAGVGRIDVYDKYPQPLEAAQNLHLPNLNVHLLDLDQPLEQELHKSDVGVAMRVFEYCKNPALAYSTVLSALKPSAWLIMSTARGIGDSSSHRMELKWQKKDREVYHIGTSFRAPGIDEDSIARLMCS